MRAGPSFKGTRAIPTKMPPASDVTQEHASWHDLLAFATHHPMLSMGDKRQVLGATARAVLR